MKNTLEKHYLSEPRLLQADTSLQTDRHDLLKCKVNLI